MYDVDGFESNIDFDVLHVRKISLFKKLTQSKMKKLNCLLFTDIYTIYQPFRTISTHMFIYCEKIFTIFSFVNTSKQSWVLSLLFHLSVTEINVFKCIILSLPLLVGFFEL